MRKLFLAIALIVGSSTLSAAPRYQLTPGKILRYTQHFENTSTGMTQLIDGNFEITILRERPDGFRRILCVRNTSYTTTTNGSTDTSNMSAQRVWFDMKPNGELRLSPGATAAPNIQMIFPRLPEDDDAAAKGWNDLYPPSNVTTNYSPAEMKDTALVFTGTEAGPYHAVNKRVDKWTFTFDPAKGFVTQIDAENSQETNGPQTGKAELRLDAEDNLSEELLKTWSDETDAMADAETKARELVRALYVSGADPDAASDQVNQLLLAGNSNATVDFVKAYGERLQQALGSEINRYKSEVVPHKGQPANEWTLNDLAGNAHSLTDYKGKVLVLDFFTRDTSTSMFQMPGIKKLAEKYKDKPVAVVGMSNDANTDDAKVVVDALELTYPVIHAEGSLETFGLQYPPGVVVIDQEGVIRAIFPGAKSTRGDDLQTVIDALLQPKP